MDNNNFLDVVKPEGLVRLVGFLARLLDNDTSMNGYIFTFTSDGSRPAVVDEDGQVQSCFGPGTYLQLVLFRSDMYEYRLMHEKVLPFVGNYLTSDHDTGSSYGASTTFTFRLNDSPLDAAEINDVGVDWIA